MLLSSLSLQTLAMHGRQRSRQLFTTAEQADARQSVAMDFLQRASAANRCLLALPSTQWGDSGLCSGADPQRLQAGLSRALAWQLSVGSPKTSLLEPCNGDGLMLRSPSSSWCCRNDAH
jgi:hypothetical protein